MNKELKVVFLRSRRNRFGCDGHPALKCEPNGTIRANRFGKALTRERWNLYVIDDSDDNKKIALQSWTGKYLSAKPNGDVMADADAIGTQEVWILKGAGKESPFTGLLSHFGKYLTCDDFFICGKAVKNNRDKMQEWEHWIITDDPHAMTHPGQTNRLALKGTLIAVGSLLTIGSICVPILGFAAEGVVLGSAAASIQSAIYGGATCGVFSVLQSVGATMMWVPIAVGGGGAIAAGAALPIGKKDEDASIGGDTRKPE